MTFKLEINCDNDAFMDRDGNEGTGFALNEVKRILKEYADDPASWGSKKLYDINGNPVGKATIK